MEAIKSIRTKNFNIAIVAVNGERLDVIISPKTESGKLLTRFANYTRNQSRAIAATALVSFACGLETKLAQLMALQG